MLRFPQPLKTFSVPLLGEIDVKDRSRSGGTTGGRDRDGKDPTINRALLIVYVVLNIEVLVLAAVVGWGLRA